MATSKLSLVKTDVHDLSKKPMGTSPRLASIKPSPIHHITKPLPESALKELKIEISFLIKQDKKSNYLKGQKLDLLQKERSRGRTGTFMRDLRDMRINYHKARSEEHTSELLSPCNLVCRL